jgi:uncharacterized membrane protein
MKNNSKINVPAVLAYIFWIGWIIAFIVRDKSDRFAALHLNQALVLNIIVTLAGVLRIVPLLGHLAYNIVSIAALILLFMGIYRALTWDERPIPFIGEIRIF